MPYAAAVLVCTVRVWSVYQGTLEQRQRQVFVGRRLWIYVFAPANRVPRENPQTAAGQKPDGTIVRAQRIS